MDERVFATARGSADHPWLQKWVSKLDGWLRRRQRVFEYLGLATASSARRSIISTATFDLPDGVHLRSGDCVVRLHLWDFDLAILQTSTPSFGSDVKAATALKTVSLKVGFVGAKVAVSSMRHPIRRSPKRRA
jgi:hypothetical protein